MPLPLARFLATAAARTPPTTTTSTTAHRATVLAAWRDYLELLRRLPPAAAAERKADAAAAVRAGAAEPDADGLKRLLAAVATLRATTAKRPGERRTGRGGVFVLRRGELVDGGGGSEGEKRCVVRFFFFFFCFPTSTTLHPFHHTKQNPSSSNSAVGAGRLSMGEAVDRHRALLRRQYFGRDPPPGTRLF
jgi:hypothetical protein